MNNGKRLAACSAMAWCVLSSGARAGASEGCTTQISRSNVAHCAVAASPAIQRERHGVEALEGRRRAASALLPSNPELGFSGGHRRTTNNRATNWYVTVSQEVEIAGQRGARRQEASTARNARQQALAVTERDVAAEAWRVYFEALAARDALRVAERLEQAFGRGTKALQAGVAQGLVSGVDGQVAEVTLLRLTQARLDARRRMLNANAAILSLVGQDPALAKVDIEGELAPLAHASTLRVDRMDEIVDARPEVLEAKQTLQSHGFGISALRRSRVPNPTFSFIAQRDGFDEKVLGGGVSLPIPLPHPIGRTFSGEIAERQALGRQTEAELAATRRAVRLEIVSAWQSFAAAKEQRELFTETRVQEAERALGSLADEISAGRLSIRDAVVSQQALIEFVRAYVDANLDLCLSSVALARAAGLALVGDAL